MTEVRSAGVVLSKSLPGGHGHDHVASTCQASAADDTKDAQERPWMQKFNRKRFDEVLMADCAGHVSCTPSFNMNEIMPLAEEERFENMMFFAQVFCTQGEDDLANKNIWGMVSACICL